MTTSRIVVALLTARATAANVDDAKPCPPGTERELGRLDRPCNAPALTCGKNFQGVCQPGQNIAAADKKCAGGVCTPDTCCEAKLCDTTQTDALCIGQWLPKVFKTADYKLSELGASSCPVGWSGVDSLAACREAARILHLSFIKEVKSQRYPHGCFQCTSQQECRALLDSVSPAEWTGFYWNDSPASANDKVSALKHIGTKKPCKADPPGCDPAGCKAETCCMPLRCGDNFKEACLPGELPKPQTTFCNVNSQTRTNTCTRNECCEAKTCSKADLSQLCTKGWLVDPNKSNTICDKQGCDQQTCCKRELCATDFKGRCSAGEDFLAAVPCPVSGCTKETCCKRKTCLSYSCKSDCSKDWIRKQKTRFCPLSGCDEQTCCEVPSCNLDWHGKCANGEVPNDPHTLCPNGRCTADVCCVKKLCSESFSCSAHGLPLGLKPRSAGTECLSTGCDANTCCETATCGKNFPSGGCGPWATQKDPGTVCNSGECTEESCCMKKECVIHQATCNTEKIKGIESFDVYSTRFPSANHNAAQAEGACSSVDRSQCFATMDVNCDGKELRRCIPNHANDPSDVILRPSAKSCVCYRREQQTCGYNLPQGMLCGGGEMVDFYATCGGDSGKLCNKETCCKPLTCTTSSFKCGVGSVVLDGDTICPKDGCNAETCCTQLTCSADFHEGCPEHTMPVPGNIPCSSGKCTVDTCCKAVQHTTPVPSASVCRTEYRGACGSGEEFMPHNLCEGSAEQSAPKACTRKQCCQPIGSILTCESFNGCESALGMVPKNGHIMCPAGGCSTNHCCRPKACGDFFREATGAGACAANQNRGPDAIACNGPCTPDICCRDQPTTTLPPNPCTTEPSPAATEPSPAASMWYFEPFGQGTAVTCGGPNKIRCASKDGVDCIWGKFAGKAPYTPVVDVPAAIQFTEVDCPGWNKDFDACKKLGCYSGTPPTPTTPPEPECGHVFAVGAKDTTACPAGFIPIETVEKCSEAAQFLKIKPSDVNGDGARVDVKDKEAITRFIAEREIAADSPLGIHKPHGCFADVSLRVVKSEKQKITTIWLNHRTAGSGRHDNSVPICQQACQKTLQRYATGSAADARQKLSSESAYREALPNFAILGMIVAALLSFASYMHRRRRRYGDKSYRSMTRRDDFHHWADSETQGTEEALE